MCPTKQSLIEKYDVAVGRYLDAVARMRRGAILPLVHFEALYDLAMSANLLCEVAHDALRSHMEEHGCRRLTNSNNCGQRHLRGRHGEVQASAAFALRAQASKCCAVSDEVSGQN